MSVSSSLESEYIQQILTWGSILTRCYQKPDLKHQNVLLSVNASYLSDKLAFIYIVVRSLSFYNIVGSETKQ